MTELLNIDCMEYMKTIPDKYFDLGIADPPYGIKEHGKGISRHRGGQVFTCFENKGWDNKIPDKEYFDELFRVSKNQIIFGANYFVHYLKPSMGWISWDKLLRADFSDGELIYTSYNKALKIFVKSPEKNYATNKVSADKYKRIHPCQKPRPLYKFCYEFANLKQGDKILDTHLGSGSSAIVADKMGFDFVGCEIDKDYFNDAKIRFDKETDFGMFNGIENVKSEPDVWQGKKEKI